MAPSHRRGPWVPEEDQLLLQLVREQGPNNWVRISQHMHYRSPKQCRERFHQNLKPSLNREPISAEEGLMIERMVNEMGRRWAEIARRLGNRSDNAVKNWWNGSMNRKRRGLSSPPASRTFNGRIEQPYARASIAGSARPRFATRPWTESSPITSPDGLSHTRRESSISVIRQLSPIYTLPSINRSIETPLTSPAFSDASHTGSVEPPSMVSDHNSVSSASPRTLPSPQISPMRGDSTAQYDTYRPTSVSVRVLEDTPTTYPSRSTDHFPIASKGSWSDHVPTYPSWYKTTDSLPKPWATRPIELPRDERMGLNNLLN